MTRAILAIDQGTTGSTCLVVTADGRITGRGYREISQHFPAPGEVEHDAMEIFERTREAGREAIAQSVAEAGIAPEAIGITNQRETVVVWDRETGEPLGRAIVWQDRRTAKRCAELVGDADEIAARTGLVLDPYFSATKLEWILQNRAGAGGGARARWIAGTIDTWLVWRLTGGSAHVTDPTNASRTMLFDIDRRSWSDELLRRFGVPRDMLPEVRPSAGHFGVADATHFGRELPILGVAGDQQAALFGQGCWTAGTGKNTYGTGAFLLLNTGSQRPVGGRGLLTTLACDAEGAACYAHEASIFIAGAAVQWLRDGLGVLARASETEALARSLESNEGVYFVPALTGLGAPHWDARARGTIVGLTRGTTRAHFARAALEAMCYGTADVLAAMRAASGATLDVLRVDGGAAANDWLMQFQADVVGAPVERPDIVESTALGAAALAGITAGVWRDAGEFASARRFTRFVVGPGHANAAAGLRGWHRAVNTALHWASIEEG
ncbi:MAG: glycerol kinase GlpK [Gemmatimonadetes bacterium]|nr:glycerol kinase GlpK [Gemmatimonadota bacterium]